MRLLIIGGGRLAEGLLVNLLANVENIYVEIVEKSQSRANHLAVLDTMVPRREKPLNAFYGKNYVIATLDALSEDFMRNYAPESLESFDCIFVGTGDDMTNIRIVAKIMKQVIGYLQKEMEKEGSEEEKKRYERRMEDFRKKVIVRIKDPLFEKFVTKLGAKALSLTAIRGVLMLELFVNTFLFDSEETPFHILWLSPERRIALISIDLQALKKTPRYLEEEKSGESFLHFLADFLTFLTAPKYESPEEGGEPKGESPELEILGLKGEEIFDPKLPMKVMKREEGSLEEVTKFKEIYLFVTIPEGMRELLAYLAKKRPDKLREINALLKEIYAGKEEETIRVLYFIPKEEKVDVELEKKINAIHEELSRRGILSPEIAREKDERKEEDELRSMIKEVLSSQYSEMERRWDTLVKGIENVEREIGPEIINKVRKDWEEVLNKLEKWKKELERIEGSSGSKLQEGILKETEALKDKIMSSITLLQKYEGALRKIAEENREEEVKVEEKKPQQEDLEKEYLLTSMLIKGHPVVAVFSQSDKTDINVLLATSIIMDALERISRYGWYFLVIYDPTVKSLLDVEIKESGEYSEIKAKSVLEDGAELAASIILGIENVLSLIVGEGMEIFGLEIPPSITLRKKREDVLKGLFSPSKFAEFVRKEIREDIAEKIEIIGLWKLPGEVFDLVSEKTDLIFYDFSNFYEIQEGQKTLVVYRPRVKRLLILGVVEGIKEILSGLGEHTDELCKELERIYLGEKEENERWRECPLGLWLGL